MSSPLFSVVVPTCRRPRALARLLDSLRPERQGLAADRYEIIVSDDDAGDPGMAAIREHFPSVRFVEGPRRGPAANRNSGAHAASGAWLVFVDDDCEPADTWLRAIQEFTANGSLGVIEGKIVTPDKQRSLFRREVENLNGGCFWSANLTIRRTVFEQLGGFDEDFLQAGGEDMELAHRFREHGIRTAFCPGALVHHPAHVLGWRDVFEYVFRIRWYQLYLLKTNAGVRLGAPIPKALVSVSVSHSMSLLRNTWRFMRPNGPRPSHLLASGLLLQWLMLPILLPYLMYWELRFRRMLAAREGGRVASSGDAGENLLT